MKAPDQKQVQTLTGVQVKSLKGAVGANPHGGAIALYVCRNFFVAHGDSLAPSGTPSGDREPARATKVSISQDELFTG